MTLEDLDALVEQWHDRPYILVSAEDWEGLARLIAPRQVVHATDDRPAFFWHRDKRIVTPVYHEMFQRNKAAMERIAAIR